MAATPYNRALDLLAARAYASKDLRRKLIQKGVPQAEVDAVIERLTEAGLLDDTKYATAYARNKLLGVGASRRRITQELARKGITGDTAAEAVDQVVADEDVDIRDVIERVARKKLASMGELEPLVLRRRLYAFLARRGYTPDEIQAVVQGLFAGIDSRE